MFGSGFLNELRTLFLEMRYFLNSSSGTPLLALGLGDGARELFIENFWLIDGLDGS